jgi:hypothetical protein
LKEAQKGKYFVDGFFIKHFGVWPAGVDKNDLYYEQKEFLIYLMGTLPAIEDWKSQVNYETELQEIKDLDKIDISESDIDVARLQGRDIKKLKADRLKAEKVKRITELRKKYGLKPLVEEVQPVKGLPEIKPEDRRKPQEKLWDMLQGKGLIK